MAALQPLFFLSVPREKLHGCRQKKEGGEERWKEEKRRPLWLSGLQQHAVAICCSRWTWYPGNCIEAEGAPPDESRGAFQMEEPSMRQQRGHHLPAGKITWPHPATVLPAAPQRPVSGCLPPKHPPPDPPTRGSGEEHCHLCFLQHIWNNSQVVGTNPDGANGLGLS